MIGDSRNELATRDGAAIERNLCCSRGRERDSDFSVACSPHWIREQFPPLEGGQQGICREQATSYGTDVWTGAKEIVHMMQSTTASNERIRL
jgi:hypothetical protein